MPKFDRYFLSQLVVLFGFFALVLVSVYWLNQAVQLFDQLIGDGQSALVFLQFSALALPNVIRLVLPVAGFVATLYCVNRLLSDSELVVVQATGFSCFRLARPVLVFGLLVAGLVLILNNFLVPISRTQLAQQEAEISNNVTAQFLTPGQFLHPARGITFFIGEISPRGELRDVFLSDARSSGSRTTYTAQRALLVQSEDGPKLLMFQGIAQTERLSDSRLSVTHFSDSVFDINALFRASGARRQRIEELRTSELIRAEPAQIEALNSDRATFMHEGHARIAQPLSAAAGVLIGFATLMLGAFSRFGVWRQIALAVALVVGLNVVYNLMADMALSSAALWPLLYTPALLGAGLAAVMLWLSDHPHLLPKMIGSRA